MLLLGFVFEDKGGVFFLFTTALQHTTKTQRKDGSQKHKSYLCPLLNYNTVSPSATEQEQSFMWYNIHLIVSAL